MNYHEPVLQNEVLQALNVKKDGLYIDCTLCDGGHTLEILKKGGRVLGLDIDDGSLERAKNRINALEDKKYIENFIGEKISNRKR